MSYQGLTHFDEQGQARMVDVGDKADTQRVAVARGSVTMKRETLELIRAGQVAKGDVLGVARIGGIMAAKRTSELIPLCHNIQLTSVEIEFQLPPEGEGDSVIIESRVKTVGKTGAEMEALSAVSVAALTIYDMCKAVDKSMVIGDVRLIYKAGGKSGEWQAGEAAGLERVE